MPSPISHFAAGAILYRCIPAEKREQWNGRIFKAPWLLLITLGLSMLPDLDAILGFLNADMSSYHNQASHSLFTGLFAAVVAGLLVRIWLKHSFVFAFLLVISAFTLHLVLDTFTYGRGLMLLWPFSTQRFISPLLIFYGVRWSEGLWSISHVWTVVTEVGLWAVVYGVIYLFRRQKPGFFKTS